jgi:integrase/recombinase XerD
MAIQVVTIKIYDSNSDVLPTNVSWRAQFHEAVRLFLMYCRYRNLASTTIQFYKWELQRLEVFLEQAHLDFLCLVSTDLNLSLMHYLLDKKITPNSINCLIRTCRVFFPFLMKEGILENNIASGLKLIKAQNQMVYTFTEEQVESILIQPNQTTFTGFRDYVMMLVLLDTGIRVMELSNMKISDIDFMEKNICIPEGKGRKHRYVPIQTTCSNELKKYIRERGQQPFEELWITISNQPLKKQAIEVLVRVHCKKANIKGTRGSCHTFRHTMAKYYLLNGGDVFSLMKILGHSTLDMTRRYIDLFSNDIHVQHEKASPLEYMMIPDEALVESEGNQI